MMQQSGLHAPRVEVPVVIHDELGLHARPAARLAQAAQAFSADVQILAEHGEADAKSILDILSLAAGYGSRLTLVDYEAFGLKLDLPLAFLLTIPVALLVLFLLPRTKKNYQDLILF